MLAELAEIRRRQVALVFGQRRVYAERLQCQAAATMMNSLRKRGSQAMNEHGVQVRSNSGRRNPSSCWVMVVGCLACWCGLVTLRSSAGAETFEPALRRPVGLVLSPDNATLWVANQRSGTISKLDVARQQVILETPVGRRLQDLIATADRRWLLAVDDAAHELIVLEPGAGISPPQVKQRLAVSPYPVGVIARRDGSRAYVTSLWSRRLTIVDLPREPGQVARIVRVIDLDLAPRKMILVQDERFLIVAEAFGGKLAVFDTSDDKLVGTREFPGHNVRGLGFNPESQMLVVSHQMLNDLAHTIRNDVHWGLLMSNDLRWLKLDRVLSGNGELFQGGHMHPLGHAGNATGDPAGLVMAPNGTVVVALGGVGEVAIGRESDFSLHRTPVGRRPTAVVVTSDSKTALVANMFGDSISVVDLDDREAKAEISLGPQPTLTSVDRGELLFYDAQLSHDGWMSCNSCHPDGHTNGQLNDNFSDASFGAPKRVLTLLGRADTAPFAWNASSATLPEQIRKSLTVTMQTDRTVSERMLGDLTAYVESLQSPPSVAALRGTQDDAAVVRGRELFQEQRCQRCHAAPTYTTPKTYNVGLKDQEGNDHFNPPSLRGVGQRAPYFHDNRAASLDEVFRKFQHQLKRELSDAELSDLKAFLGSL